MGELGAWPGGEQFTLGEAGGALTCQRNCTWTGASGVHGARVVVGGEARVM